MSLPDDGTLTFETQRPRLVRLAYRMLGSVAEAEDVVQDAWLRWQQADRTAVDTPAAFLSRIVTRLCLDVMKSARSRRETYVGSWLPEPMIEEPDEMDQDDLTLTLMLVLERLSPLERAAFLLHDVFGVPLDEVAATVEREPAAVRQLAARARKHVQDSRPRFPVARDEGSRIAEAFFVATRSGDTNALRSILAQNVVIRSDGGGKVLAFLNPIVGLERVLRLYEGLSRKLGIKKSDTFEPMRIDGLPGYVSFERDNVFQTTAFAIEDGKITEIYITRNPDKLRHVAEALNVSGSPETRH
ncbi:sigma-70 family RNA polymerase sigma factor [Afipia massiliensis]|uniref:Sigma-70 family RNA polymerase sigma factor n=1 Tax=Afipia massiliensis TaxID=211460 RepID=A0A4U6BPP3_9BRAD|nr:sigma-70 family RNA polymerase sigma factor [Afipia massiliensis]TKT72362.1 sigma-70 family RNA polymerase sigma factor [Afipia massiliensis]